MTVQRTLTDSLIAKNYIGLQGAPYWVSAQAGLQRMIWICETCGMIYAEALPTTCESCGNTATFSMQPDTRSEITYRG